ncbi:MAG: universal stress protein [Pirellulaceae bacterium]|nr:universal stress protein [Planctomycetales bacterium]
MTVKQILVPTDFSPSAEAALRYATLLAHETDATLAVLHVHATPALKGAEDDLHDSEAAKARERLRAVEPLGHAVAIEHHFVVGQPSEVIHRLAERLEVDAVVMGAHGETDSPHVLLGAVASAVLAKATTPVLTVKLPK